MHELNYLMDFDSFSTSAVLGSDFDSRKSYGGVFRVILMLVEGKKIQWGAFMAYFSNPKAFKDC